MSLQQKGVRADYLGSTQTNLAVSNFAQSGLYDVLYLTPEKAISLPGRYELHFCLISTVHKSQQPIQMNLMFNFLTS